MIDVCPVCQIATPCDCEDDPQIVKVTRKERNAMCVALVERLAQMPDINENMRNTWCPPDWHDLSDWWRDFVREARKITGRSYHG